MNRRLPVLALAALLCGGWMPADSRGPVRMQASKPKTSSGADLAPEFTLKDADGKDVVLASFRGKKVVILDFWATWCGPCRASMPGLQDYWLKNKSKGIELLSINQQEDVGRVRAFLQQTGFKFHVLLDSDGGVSREYQVYGIPTLFVIDKEGALRYKTVGYRPDLDTRLAEIITPLL